MAERVNVPSVNRILISGRITRDSELRFTPDNTAILSFSIAYSRRYKSRDGEWKENTSFFDINYWGRFAENIAPRLKTGVPVFVEGSLEQSVWEDRNSGEKRSKIRIRADRVHVLVRDVDDVASGTRNLDKTINDMDKEFDEIIDNENSGGDDGIPF